MEWLMMRREAAWYFELLLDGDPSDDGTVPSSL